MNFAFENRKGTLGNYKISENCEPISEEKRREKKRKEGEDVDGFVDKGESFCAFGWVKASSFS